jgi:hypothetical protein
MISGSEKDIYGDLSLSHKKSFSQKVFLTNGVSRNILHLTERLSQSFQKTLRIEPF